MRTTRSSGPLIKPEPVAHSIPSNSTLSPDGDINMTDSLHPDLHQELVDASAQSSRGTPASSHVNSLPDLAHPPSHDIMTDAPPLDQGINVLGHKIKHLVQTMDKFQQLGIETTELPLPKIVVVGDQSAGKSSLVEGLSGIKVPRSTGTCTRCPLQVTLAASSTQDWVCKITLQKKYSLYSSAGTEPSPYGRWQPDHEVVEIPFTVVHNTADLEKALRSAQLATLNPGSSPQQYLTEENIDDMPVQIGFSPNPIRLDITGPELPNLSFFDLPGIINQTEKPADRWYVTLVKNLVTEYIQQESSLILLACSMETDIQNNSAAALIAACEGANERTVAVLTKPDQIQPGYPWTTVQKILDNQIFCVGHGYYVTKQPSQEKLNQNISTEAARAEERAFFDQPRWSIDFASHHARFGTAQLREALSEKLTEQILISLPTIKAKVLSRLDDIEVELTRFPDPPSNAMGKILEALGKFNTAVERHVEGVQPFNDLRNNVKKLASAFEKGLQGQRPTLLVATPPGFSKQVIVLSDDDEAEPESRAQTPMEMVTPTNKRKRPNETPIKSARPQFKMQMQSQQNTPRTAHTAHDSKKLGLMDVRNTLERLSLSNIPNEIDPRAVDHLRSQSLLGWGDPMEMFLNKVAESLEATLGQLLKDACEGWLASDFYKDAKQILETFLGTIIDEQRNYARRAFRLEQHKPLTMNNEGFKAATSAELERLANFRLTKRALEHLHRTDKSASKQLDEDEAQEKLKHQQKKAATDHKLRAELGPDPFQREIEVMARVRGYYSVALLRFLDHVVQGVHAEAFVKCIDELPSQLRAGLMLESHDAQDHCNRMLAENPEREVHRLQLKKEKSNLVEAQQWLANLEDARF